MKWLYGILCLFFLIIFHEFGHFIAAKIFGVKVESFSIGFGPVLFHKQIKGTDFRLSLIPLGGYCGMKGEKDFQKAIDENLTFIQGEKDSLYGTHPVKRALIGFAGPFFNFIFAIIAYSFINGIGYTYFTYSNKILINDKVTSSVAKNAGIKSGDKIIEINNKKTEDFSDILFEISSRPEEKIKIKLDRNGELLELELITEMDKATGQGKIGIAADSSNLLQKESQTYGLFSSIGHGFADTLQSTVLTIKGIATLFKGVDLDNSLSGPLRTTFLIGDTAQQSFHEGFKSGFITLMSLLAVISISLFIMNLLPVPVLDGGLILIALIEFISRRKINPKIQYYIQFIGLAFIIILFIIGLKGDILFFINRGK